MSAAATPTCVWRASADLVLGLARTFGDPDDGYVNGSQVWLRDNDRKITLEWRLHPVADFAQAARATGLAEAPGAHHDLFAAVAFQLANDPDCLTVEQLWDGLECFPAYGDELEPAALARSAEVLLGAAPDAFGLVDHDAIGAAWEAAQGKMSILAALFDQLSAVHSQPEDSASGGSGQASG